MKEYYIAIIKFPLLVTLSLVLLVTAFFGVALGSWFKLGLSGMEIFLFVSGFIILIVLIFGWVLNLMSTHRKIRPRRLEIFCRWMLYNVYYYFAKWLGKISFQKKLDIQESFLNFNNEMVLSAAAKVSHTNILLLLPHCLQRSDCTVRVTGDINNCEDCGRCGIAEIKALAKREEVKAAVATGGSLARKIILDNKPDVIVAVACHRDLVDGMRDSWRHSIYAVLNERPKGPCFETEVSIKTIEFAIKKFK
ncbi:MAG: DUF116 domain-containing protein [Candidatus Cloacimonetes bacterium]|nr:DUF116 domain-containing protein [Candidatus Cloacimonadota bacterium]